MERAGGGSSGKPAHGKPAHGKPAHGRKKRFGAALGLDQFAKAKTKQYDKREQREKERALNAAKVNKFKKLQKRLGDKLEPKIKLTQEPLDEDDAEQQQDQRQRQQQGAPNEAQEQHGDERQLGAAPPHSHEQQQGQGQQQQRQWKGKPGGGKPGKQHKPLSRMQRIAAEAQAEKEAEAAEREARRQAAEERARKLAEDAKRRAAKSKQLYKKTGHGQPVMKYRVEKMLAALQQGQ